MANSRNLKPWPKSTSGNPAGRPRHDKITTAINEELAKVSPHDRAGRTNAELIADAMVRRAIRGDIQAVKEITRRTEGRAPLRVYPDPDAH
jgi:Family of unknown function (DUF5681)